MQARERGELPVPVFGRKEGSLSVLREAGTVSGVPDLTVLPDYDILFTYGSDEKEVLYENAQNPVLLRFGISADNTVCSCLCGMEEELIMKDLLMKY